MYFDILTRKTVGSFQVPMIHSTFLINIQHNLTDKLQFYPVQDTYTVEIDDILVFAHTAKFAGNLISEQKYACFNFSKIGESNHSYSFAYFSSNNNKKPKRFENSQLLRKT